MPDLVPRFILEKYAVGQHQGEFLAATLFMDISGFTAMTQTLMQQGKEGAEWVAAALNRVFAPITQVVADHGGFITGFAGDAFTAVFPGQGHMPALRACQSALVIHRHVTELGKQTTPAGTFTLGVKQGISAGLVEWGILGPEQHKSYFFRGPAIRGCIAAEQMAVTGVIVVDEELQTWLEPGAVALLPWHKAWTQLDEILVETKEPVAAASQPIPLELIEHFFPLSLADVGQQGEFRNVAIAFISFLDEPHFAQLDDFVSRVIQAAQRFGGHFAEVDFGDKGGLALIYFGAPTSHENDIVRALDFILFCQTELAEVGLLWRAGITFGQVYAGLIGSDLQAKYTTLGNRVNLASRLMVQAQWGQTLVADQVARQAGYRFEHLGDFVYKGLTRRVPTYQFNGAASDVEAQFKQTMVGRDTELHRLYSFTKTYLSEGKAGVILLYGEPGIGKSHLSHALRQTLDNTVSWFTGQTDQVLQQAFDPFVYWLKRYFRQTSDLVSKEENKRRFMAQIEALAALSPPDFYQELQRTHSFLGALLGLFWSHSLYEQVDNSLRYVNIITGIKTILLIESQLRPVVLEIDDGQWLDDASHELLTHLGQAIPLHPLLILITSRYLDDGSKPTFHLAKQLPHLSLELEALPPAALRQQARDILGGPVDGALLQVLQEKTQANPFFAQQILYYLKETQQIKQDVRGTWTIEATNFDLPLSINAILIARLDRLTLAVKQVVQAAAVLGREFELHVLSHMLQADVTDMVQEAEQEQIWSPLQELRYLFKHVLLRDAAYEMQLRAQLRKLHELAAATYEYLFAREGDERGNFYASRIASHYERAGNMTQMAVWYGRAGKQAQENYALDDAAAAYQKALQAGVLDAAAQLPLYDGLGETQRQQAHYDDARATYQQMLALAHNNNHRVGQVRAEIGLAWVWQCQGEYQASLDSAVRAEQLLRQMEPLDFIQLAEVLYHKGWAHFFLGQAQEALHAATEERNLSEDAHHDKGLLQSLNLLSVVQYYSLGQHAAAAKNQQMALALARTNGDRHSEGFLLNNLGENLLQQGDDQQAAVCYEQACAIAREIGDRDGELAYRSNLAGAQVSLGQFDAAATILRDVIARAPADWYVLPDSYYYLAEAYLGLQQVDEAVAAAYRAFALSHNDDNLGRVWRVLGDAAAHLGQMILVNEVEYHAAECYEKSVMLLAAASMIREQAITLWHWAQYERDQGSHQQGEELRQAAQAIFQKLHLPLWVVKTGTFLDFLKPTL